MTFPILAELIRSRRLARRLGAITITSLTALTLSGCDNGGPGFAQDSTTGGGQASVASDPDPAQGAEQRAGTDVRIRVGDQTVTATVWGTPTGQALLDQLPLTLSFEDLNGVEKVARLPKELPTNGMPAGDDPEISDLGYYAPWGNLVLYYGEVSYWDGIARIGHIDGNLSAIAEQNDDFTAVVELGH